ncbi:MAG: hypothetical protein ACYDHM_11780 [Acidiferrobacterales bacterium]
MNYHKKRALWAWIAAIAAIAACFGAAYALSGGPDSPVPSPLAGVYLGKGKKCVAPVSVMRRYHMQFLLNQRNLTVHEGIRTKRFLLTNCVDCHADPKTHSVLGKHGFCASCHEYAAVQIDCFSCHSPHPEQLTAQSAASLAPQSSRIAEMVKETAITQIKSDPVDGPQ